MAFHWAVGQMIHSTVVGGYRGFYLSKYFLEKNTTEEKMSLRGSCDPLITVFLIKKI